MVGDFRWQKPAVGGRAEHVRSARVSLRADEVIE